jgi:predicted unusual protein kinase regulating ubiquinone biosynthesis (AarF/ABC1/UbiB family)
VHAVLNLLVYAALNLKVLVVAQCLRARRNVRVPRVLDALSCKSVLTMEYVEDMFKVSP